MPWTFAHPAAVLPLRHLGPIRMPFTGLVMGSISPDFGYYIGRFDLATYAHSAYGIAFVCLPIAFFFATLLAKFHHFLVAPLPDPLRTALTCQPPAPLWPLSQAALMAIAILLGATTHVAWDSLTHATGAVVLSFSLLRNELFVLDGRPFAVYHLLQHTSTLLGLVALITAYRRWLRNSVSVEHGTERRNFRCYLNLSLIAVLSSALGITVALVVANPGAPLMVVIFRWAIYSTAAFVAAYLALAFYAGSRSEV